MPVENLSQRMSAAAPSATPKPTPGKWAKADRKGAAWAPAPTPMGAFMAAATPSGAAAFGRREHLARTPAHPSAAGSSAAAEEAPAPSSQPMTLGHPLPAGFRVESVDSAAVGAIGSARHQDDKKRRKSRKSFARSVAHPRSPCARAARAGMGMDPKAAIRGEGAESVEQFTAYDALGHLRTKLMIDGSVINAQGNLLAYIEADGTVGAPDLDYVGEVTAPSDASLGFITDRNDELVGQVDYGQALIRDANGSTIASFTRNGDVCGHTGARCGTLDGFSFEQLRMAAAYLILVDPDYLNGPRPF
jgi:hypothetical protein